MEYANLEQARSSSGLRMVVTAGAPGPWSEAAKAFFRLKGLDYLAVAHRGGMDDPGLIAWTGTASAPVAFYNDERPRAHWSEILLLAERLSALPRLIPDNEEERTAMFGLCFALCGEDGLGWNRRLLLFDALEASAANRTGAVYPNAAVSRMRHRYSGDEDNARAEARLVSIFGMMAAILRRQRAAGSDWFVGNAMSAADIYWAAFSNLFVPMAAADCPMPDYYRKNGDTLTPAVRTAITPDLLAHRDKVARLAFSLPMDF